MKGAGQYAIGICDQQLGQNKNFQEWVAAGGYKEEPIVKHKDGQYQGKKSGVIGSIILW